MLKRNKGKNSKKKVKEQEQEHEYDYVELKKQLDAYLLKIQELGAELRDAQDNTVIHQCKLLREKLLEFSN